MRYNIVQTNTGESVTAIVDGDVLVADESHPNYERIVDALRADGDPSEVAELFDISAGLARRFAHLSERVLVQDGRVLFDGDELDNSLTKAIVRFYEDGRDHIWQPLVMFLEKVMANPSSHSREQLFEWLSRRDFSITEEGNIVAYKGVRQDEDGTFRSIHSGEAIVDGQPVQGNIPNDLGAIIEMPRSNVAWDPSVGCSVGLHAGTWDYAEGFGRGHVLTVSVNPRDVVSVPTDSDAAKVRVCRYRVLNVTEVQYDDLVLSDDEATPFLADEDWDEVESEDDEYLDGEPVEDWRSDDDEYDGDDYYVHGNARRFS